MKLTTAKYYTPLGRSIQKTGIDPDILVVQAELKKLLEPETAPRKEADLRGAINNEQNSTQDQKQKKSTNKTDDSLDDYQLSRAFDLILALDLANNKYKQ